MVAVTPAQLKLLQLCDHVEAAFIAEKLNSIFQLGTFLLSPDVPPDLDASLHTYYLLGDVQEIAREVDISYINYNP